MGLNLGVSDYLPKPLELAELDVLEARLRAPGSRTTTAESAASPYATGQLRYEQESGAIYHQGQAMEFTPRKLAQLQAPIVKPGHLGAKERLFELVLPDEADVQYEAVEVVVYRLRKKLVANGVRLVTLRGLGYLLKADT